jgi:HEAT repeat protein
MKNFVVVAALSVSALIGQTPSDQAWKVLKDGTAEKNTTRRANAYRALGILTGNATACTMAETGLSDPKVEPRAAAIDALGQMGATTDIQKLKEILTNATESEIVFACANSLYLLKDKSAYEVYYAVLMGERKSGDGLAASQMKMMKDPKALAQFGFEQGIGFVPFAGAGYSVLKMVTKDDISPIRAAAALKLATDPDPKSGEALASMASDKKWLVRAAVVNSIAKRGDPALLKAVIPLMGDVTKSGITGTLQSTTSIGGGDDDTNGVVKYTAAATVIKLSTADRKS